MSRFTDLIPQTARDQLIQEYGGTYVYIPTRSPHIRREIAESEGTVQQVAARFQVSHKTVMRIRRRNIDGY